MTAPSLTQAPPHPKTASAELRGQVLQRKCACGGNPGPSGECSECRKNRLTGQTRKLQTKLRVNQPGDAWEQEADRMADAVTGERLSPGISSAQPSLMRTSASTPSAVEAPASVETVLNTAGQPLAPSTQALMESRFGHDFSQVRVHTDAQAAESAQTIQALAYTVGQNIAFASGQYAPNTHAGQKLLAHELTHVVQQSGQAAHTIQRKAPGEDDIDLLTDYFKADVSAFGATLHYSPSRRVVLKVSDKSQKNAKAFAYQYLSPILRSRPYGIIRLVLAPSVSVSLEGFPTSYIPDLENPSVEIYRVQDAAQVPEQDDPINPGDYVGTSVEPAPKDDEVDLLGPGFQIERRPDGVDITHIESSETLQITVPNFSSGARFAYQVVRGNPLGMPGVVFNPSKIIVVITPDVKVLNIGPSKSSPNLSINLYQVKDASQVPAQGNPINESMLAAYQLRSWDRRTVYSSSETQSMLAVDMMVLSIPIVGELAAVGMFAYGIYTGHDHWGRPLNETDLIIMGIAAALPFAVAGGMKLAEAVSSLGRNSSEVTKILRGIDALDPAEQKKALEWAALIRKGKMIPAHEAAAFEKMLTKINEAAKQIANKIEAIDTELAKAKTELLTADNIKPFDPASDTSKFKNKKEVSKAVEKAFLEDPNYIKPSSFEQTKSEITARKTILGSDVIKGLKANTSEPANQAVLDVLKQVFETQESPKAYGKMVAIIWERAQSIPTTRVLETGRSPYTLAMIDMLIERGIQVDVILNVFRLPSTFSTQILKPGASFVDLAFAAVEHGVSPHMLQFLVIDDMLRTLKPPSTMKQFLNNLSKVTDASGNKLGGDIWNLLFDLEFLDAKPQSMRKPESVIPTLKSILPGIE